MDNFYTIVFWAAIGHVAAQVLLNLDRPLRAEFDGRAVDVGAEDGVVLAFTTIAAAMILKWLRG